MLSKGSVIRTSRKNACTYFVLRLFFSWPAAFDKKQKCGPYENKVALVCSIVLEVYHIIIGPAFVRIPLQRRSAGSGTRDEYVTIFPYHCKAGL